ncbi:MAG: hypothetical protein BWY76_01505 [bacterium ADurb.Bin429]|nr:MAG: hypothetical protein BWY76_01505 [bacterium ADurb.Bin429]
MSGLPKSTNADSASPIQSCPPMVETSSRLPISMKKKSSRKSRRLTSFAAIISRNMVDASETPPRKAPTSLPKPSQSPTKASSSAQAMANNTSSSVERASSGSRRGSTKYAAAHIPARKVIPDTIIFIAIQPGGPIASLLALSIIIAMMTTRSCTMRIPNAMRPCSASASCLSESSFTTMMVLEKVRASAI